MHQTVKKTESARLAGVQAGDWLVTLGRRRVFLKVTRLTPKRAYVGERTYVNIVNGRNGSTGTYWRIATAEEVAEKERRDKKEAEERERLKTVDQAKHGRESWQLAWDLANWFHRKTSDEIEQLLSVDALRAIKAALEGGK